MSNFIRVNITVKNGEHTKTMTDQSPLYLSGDRRKWRKQIAEHVAGQVELLSKGFDGMASDE